MKIKINNYKMGGEVLQFTKKERQHKALPFNYIIYEGSNDLLSRGSVLYLFLPDNRANFCVFPPI